MMTCTIAPEPWERARLVHRRKGVRRLELVRHGR